MTQKLETKCKADDCGRAVIAFEYCTTHYQRIRRNGTLEIHKPTTKPCSIKVCDRVAKTRGYCAVHYQHLILRGYVVEAPIKPKAKPCKCAIEDCDKQTLAKGYCKTHYHYFRRHGQLLTKVNSRLCLADKCNESVYAKKLCFNHYRSKWEQKQPLGCKCKQCKR